MTFGEAVRARRLALGLTLKQLSERSDLSPNYIGGIEMNKRDPSLDTARALARGLETPLWDLLGGLPHLSTTAIEAGRLFQEMPDDQQLHLLRFLRSLVRRPEEKADVSNAGALVEKTGGESDA